MKYCIKCGKVNTEHDIECCNCAHTKFSETTQTEFYCGNCDTMQESDGYYCDNCDNIGSMYVI